MTSCAQGDRVRLQLSTLSDSHRQFFDQFCVDETVCGNFCFLDLDYEVLILHPVGFPGQCSRQFPEETWTMDKHKVLSAARMGTEEDMACFEGRLHQWNFVFDPSQNVDSALCQWTWGRERPSTEWPPICSRKEGSASCCQHWRGPSKDNFPGVKGGGTVPDFCSAHPDQGLKSHQNCTEVCSAHSQWQTTCTQGQHIQTEPAECQNWEVLFGKDHHRWRVLGQFVWKPNQNWELWMGLSGWSAHQTDQSLAFCISNKGDVDLILWFQWASADPLCA